MSNETKKTLSSFGHYFGAQLLFSCIKQDAKTNVKNYNEHAEMKKKRCFKTEYIYIFLYRKLFGKSDSFVDM